MSEWLPGELFHQQQQPIFCGDISRAHLYKQAAEMAHVCYAPAHANPQQSGERAAQGLNRCIWVAGEQGAQAEGISRSLLDGLLDSTLEPEASIGWHHHADSEEIYYLLAGSLRVELTDEGGQHWQFELQPGDSHRVGPGMSHWAQAGAQGARFIAVMMKTRGEAS